MKAKTEKNINDLINIIKVIAGIALGFGLLYIIIIIMAMILR